MSSMYIIANSFFSLLLAFYAVTFLESGLDKVINSEGNLAFMKDHFKNSILSKAVKPIFWILTFEEVILGILFTFSILGLWIGWYNVQVPTCMFGLFVFLQLFTGQRLAKDYAGAAGLLPYVILLLVVLVMLFLNFGVN